MLRIFSLPASRSRALRLAKAPDHLLQSARLQPSMRTAYLCIVSICSVTFLSVFANGALSVAIPTIGRQLGLTQAELQWPSAVLFLANAAFLLPAGGIADAFGRRTTFMTGLILFAIAHLATGFVKNGLAFILMAAAQGMSIALLQPSSVGILSTSLPEGQFRNTAFAVFGAAQPMGFAIGLVIGGVLAENWAVIYWTVAGITMASIVLSHMVLPNDGESLLPTGHRSSTQDRQTDSTVALNASTPGPANASRTPLAQVPATTEGSPSSWQKLKTFDWLGVLLSSSGLCLLTFALADAEVSVAGFATPWIAALLPTSVLLLTVFMLWERRLERAHLLSSTDRSAPAPWALLERLAFHTRAPLVPPSIWKAKGYTAMLLTIFFAWLSFNSLPYWLTLAFQEIAGKSPLQTALYHLTCVPLGVVANILAGLLMGRVHALWLIAIGCTGSAVSPLVYALTDARWGFAQSMLVVELLLPMPDIFFSPAQIFSCTTVGPRNAALAGSLFSLMTRLSSSLGLAISSAISTSTIKRYAARKGIPQSDPDALLQGYRAAGWFCFASCCTALLIALVFLRDVGVVGGKEDLATQVNKRDEERDDEVVAVGSSKQGASIELDTLNKAQKIGPRRRSDAKDAYEDAVGLNRSDEAAAAMWVATSAAPLLPGAAVLQAPPASVLISKKAGFSTRHSET